MVIIEKKGKGTNYQETLYLHGMDLKLLFELLGKGLIEYTADDVYEYIEYEVNRINSIKDEKTKKESLRMQHSLVLEHTEKDIIFKRLLISFLEQEILYSKDILAKIVPEKIDELLNNISDQKVYYSNIKFEEAKEFNEEIDFRAKRLLEKSIKHKEYEELSLEFIRDIYKLVNEVNLIKRGESKGNEKRLKVIIDTLNTYGLNKTESFKRTRPENPLSF